MIKVRNLTKQFGDLYAVDRINFDIGEGEIFGFIGPNGSGKTTTIRMLSTLLDPDEGTAWINNHCIHTEQKEVRKIIGYMPDYFGVYEGVTIWEYLDFFARSYHIPKKVRGRIVKDCMELTDLTKLSKKMVSSLSKGMKQRLCLAKTLVHDPKVLILDEPASGLDPRARIEIRSLLKELANMGKTIFISSHILTELSDIVTSIGIVEKGKTIITGSVDDISQAITNAITIFVSIFQNQQIDKAIELLSGIKDIINVRFEDNTIKLDFNGEEKNIYTIIKKLVDEDIPVISVSKQVKNLEDIFMQITKGDVS